MKIYCITWKDERWSATKEDLKELNKLLTKNEVSKRKTLIRRVIDMIFSRKIILMIIIWFGFGS